MRIIRRWRGYAKGTLVLLASPISFAIRLKRDRDLAVRYYTTLSTMADVTAVPVHTRSRFPLNLAVATLFTLAASVCLWLAAFSTPFIKRIYYLGINREGGSTKFGTFGYCYGMEEIRCIPRDVGVSPFRRQNSSWDPDQTHRYVRSGSQV